MSRFGNGRFVAVGLFSVLRGRCRGLVIAVAGFFAAATWLLAANGVQAGEENRGKAPSDTAATASTAAFAAASTADLADSLDAFRDPKDGWLMCSDVALDPKNPKTFTYEKGRGILLSLGQGRDLMTKQNYRDCRVELEFVISKGSNAGVKLNGCYEIQILDSFGKTKLTGSDCGGIYPRAEFKPRYRTIDDGVPPRVNACREPGQWQSLVIVFRAPRFDAAGKKTANARFELVKLNGQVVQENQEVAYPTGHAWHNAEKPEGPVLFQGDHGPVAIKNLRIVPLTE